MLYNSSHYQLPMIDRTSSLSYMMARQWLGYLNSDKKVIPEGTKEFLSLNCFQLYVTNTSHMYDVFNCITTSTLIDIVFLGVVICSKL